MNPMFLAVESRKAPLERAGCTQPMRECAPPPPPPLPPFLPPSLPSSPSPQSVDHPETGSSLFCVFPKKTKQNKRRAALPQFLPQEVITESQTNFVPFMFFVHHQHQLKRARLN